MALFGLPRKTLGWQKLAWMRKRPRVCEIHERTGWKGFLLQRGAECPERACWLWGLKGSEVAWSAGMNSVCLAVWAVRPCADLRGSERERAMPGGPAVELWQTPSRLGSESKCSMAVRAAHKLYLYFPLGSDAKILFLVKYSSLFRGMGNAFEDTPSLKPLCPSQSPRKEERQKGMASWKTRCYYQPGCRGTCFRARQWLVHTGPVESARAWLWSVTQSLRKTQLLPLSPDCRCCDSPGSRREGSVMQSWGPSIWSQTSPRASPSSALWALCGPFLWSPHGVTSTGGSRLDWGSMFCFMVHTECLVAFTLKRRIGFEV